MYMQQLSPCSIARPRLRPQPGPMRLPPANCLKCATAQLQQLFSLPNIHGSQQDQLQGQQLVQRDRRWRQQSANEHQQQQEEGLSLQLAALQQQLQQRQQQVRSDCTSDLQPAWAACASSASGTSASFMPIPTAAWHGRQLYGAKHPPGSQYYLACDGAESPGCSNDASSRDASSSSSSSSSSMPALPDMPPLSSLLGQDPASPPISSSGSSGLASQGQQEQQQQQQNQEKEDSPGVKAALAMLRWYKSMLSPMMASSCRFLPTCSQYSMDSYRAYGVAKGTVLTAWRLLRCNPWGPSGYDPTTWPPPGLPGWLFGHRYSAEVAVVVGAAAFVRLSHALLFE